MAAGGGGGVYDVSDAAAFVAAMRRTYATTTAASSEVHHRRHGVEMAVLSSEPLLYEEEHSGATVVVASSTDGNVRVATESHHWLRAVFVTPSLACVAVLLVAAIITMAVLIGQHTSATNVVAPGPPSPGDIGSSDENNTICGMPSLSVSGEARITPTACTNGDPCDQHVPNCTALGYRYGFRTQDVSPGTYTLCFVPTDNGSRQLTAPDGVADERACVTYTISDDGTTLTAWNSSLALSALLVRGKNCTGTNVYDYRPDYRTSDTNQTAPPNSVITTASESNVGSGTTTATGFPSTGTTTGTALNGCGTQSTMGITSITNGSPDSNDANSFQCTFHETTYGGTIISMTVYVSVVDPSSSARGFQMAIYNDSSVPAYKIAETLPGSLGSGGSNSWHTLSLVTPVTVPGSKKLWLCYNTNATSSSYNDVYIVPFTNSETHWCARTYGLGFPSNSAGLGSCGSQPGYGQSIYANFAPCTTTTTSVASTTSVAATTSTASTNSASTSAATTTAASTSAASTHATTTSAASTTRVVTTNAASTAVASTSATSTNAATTTVAATTSMASTAAASTSAASTNAATTTAVSTTAVASTDVASTSATSTNAATTNAATTSAASTTAASTNVASTAAVSTSAASTSAASSAAESTSVASTNAVGSTAAASTAATTTNAATIAVSTSTTASVSATTSASTTGAASTSASASTTAAASTTTAADASTTAAASTAAVSTAAVSTSTTVAATTAASTTADASTNAAATTTAALDATASASVTSSTSAAAVTTTTAASSTSTVAATTTADASTAAASTAAASTAATTTSVADTTTNAAAATTSAAASTTASASTTGVDATTTGAASTAAASTAAASTAAASTSSVASSTAVTSSVASTTAASTTTMAVTTADASTLAASTAAVSTTASASTTGVDATTTAAASTTAVDATTTAVASTTGVDATTTAAVSTTAAASTTGTDATTTVAATTTAAVVVSTTVSVTSTAADSTTVASTTGAASTTVASTNTASTTAVLSTTAAATTGTDAPTTPPPTTMDPCGGDAHLDRCGNCVINDPSSVQTLTLTGRIRDFNASGTPGGHPDFEYVIHDDRGIVLSALGVDQKPVYGNHPSGTITTHNKTRFDQWYRDVPGVNLGADITITLQKQNDGVFRYSNFSFFPIDGLLFGQRSKGDNNVFHNFHFTVEFHFRFTYYGGETLTFVGDDDVFFFINNKLAIDLGGVHSAETASFDLDSHATSFGLVVGQSYNMDVFYAERHTTESDLQIETTLLLQTCQCFDGCGVCNGDNTTCAGCDGVPYSNVTTDVCGICGGDGLSCSNSTPSIGELEFCYRYDLKVNKTAVGQFDELISWLIEKSVATGNVSMADLLSPDNANETYTVTLTRSDDIVHYRILGEITITNPSPMEVNITVADSVTPPPTQGTPFTHITCESSTLEPYESQTCTYSVTNLFDDMVTLNTAIVSTSDDRVGGGTATAAVDFALFTTIGTPVIYLVDEFSLLAPELNDSTVLDSIIAHIGPFNNSTNFTYSDEVSCPDDTSLYAADENGIVTFTLNNTIYDANDTTVSATVLAQLNCSLDVRVWLDKEFVCGAESIGTVPFEFQLWDLSTDTLLEQFNVSEDSTILLNSTLTEDGDYAVFEIANVTQGWLSQPADGACHFSVNGTTRTRGYVLCSFVNVELSNLYVDSGVNEASTDSSAIDGGNDLRVILGLPDSGTVINRAPTTLIAADLSSFETYSLCARRPPVGWLMRWEIEVQYNDIDGSGTLNDPYELDLPSFTSTYSEILNLTVYDSFSFHDGVSELACYTFVPGSASIVAQLRPGRDLVVDIDYLPIPNTLHTLQFSRGAPSERNTTYWLANCDETLLPITWDAIQSNDTLTFAIADCVSVVVPLLAQNDTIITSKHRGVDAAYALARSLLTAQLNAAADALLCTEADDTIFFALNALDAINFVGTGPYLPPATPLVGMRDYALRLAATLDMYNNGQLCGEA